MIMNRNLWIWIEIYQFEKRWINMNMNKFINMNSVLWIWIEIYKYEQRLKNIYTDSRLWNEFYEYEQRFI